MISLSFVFYMFIFLGAIIGTMRGWAKELLVIFSVLLSIFIIQVFESYVGVYQAFVSQGPTTRFWAQSFIVLSLAFFGYQTPKVRRLEGAARRERLQDSILGSILGGLNAYLVIGSVWHFMAQVGYDKFAAVEAPIAGTTAGDAAIRLITMMPPQYLTIPVIYFAVAIAFTFVVIVYV